MGAWGYRILESDSANDELDNLFVELLCGVPDCLYTKIREFLSNPTDSEVAILGVAIVDASINGFDKKLFGSYGDYPEISEMFFKNITSAPLTELVPDALATLDQLIDSGATSWVEDIRSSRLGLYYTLRTRLS